MKSKKQWTNFIVMVLAFVMLNSLLCAFDSRARALDEPYQRSSLRDLPGVRVQVTDLNPDAQRGGLVKGEIQTDVESRLRKAGIRVLTEEEWRNMPRAPLLYIRVDALQGSERACAFYANVNLYQRVSIEQTPNTNLLAATWST